MPDLTEAVRFYQALGLEPDVRSRSGHWIELRAAGGELGLHDAAIVADGEGREGLALNFVADEPLEAVERPLRAAGFPPEGTIVDQDGVGRFSCGRLTEPSFRSMSKTATCTREEDDCWTKVGA